MSKLPQKITQIHCNQTNLSLKHTFLSSLSSAFKHLPNLLGSIYNELELLVGFLEYRFTIAMDRPQPGDKLQNLSFDFTKISKRIRVFWLLLTVILPYLWKRSTHFLGEHLSEELSIKVHKVISVIEKIYSLLEFINLAVFYRQGMFRTPVQRLLGIKMKFINKDSARVLNFSLMNRRLLWQIYELFLQNVMPFTHKYYCLYRRLFSSALKNIFYLNSYMGVEKENNCVVCSAQVPVMPVTAMPCKHVGCYYCIQNRKDEMNDRCRMCSEEVTEWVHSYK